MNLSDFVEHLKSTDGIQMPKMGGQFGQPIGSERFKLTDTDLSGPMKDIDIEIPADVAKAGIAAVGGTIQALAQSAFLEEEGRKDTAAKAETTRAKGQAKAAAQAGAQQFSGLANLMDVYRGVYGGRK